MSAPSSSSSSSSLREGEVAPLAAVPPIPVAPPGSAAYCISSSSSPPPRTKGELTALPATASTAVLLTSEAKKKQASEEARDEGDSKSYRRMPNAASKQLLSVTSTARMRLAVSAETERVLALRYGRSRREAAAASAATSFSSSSPTARQQPQRVSASAPLYWSEREKNFGPNQRRLRLTHEESDLLLNVQEHAWVFPRTSSAPGACGYLLDGTAPFPLTMSDESRWRCLFFLATCGISPPEWDSPQGVSSVSVVVIVPSPEADPSHIDQVGQNLGKLLSYLSLMPSVHVDDIHLVAIAEPDSDHDDNHAILEYFQESLGPKIRTKSHVHLVRSHAEAADVLEAHGTMKRETLPNRVGGYQTRQQCSEWLIQRSRVVEVASDDDDADDNSKVEEEEVASFRDGSPTSTAADEAAVPPRASSGRPAAASASASASAPTANNNANTQEFIRKRNAVYARRKYARRKIEVEVLKEQRHDLERQKQRLQAQNRRLTGLLEHAELCVDRYLASGGVAGVAGLDGGGGASHAALTVTHLLPPAESKYSDPKDRGGGRDASAASASRRTRLLLMEQLRLQDQLASSSSSSSAAAVAAAALQRGVDSASSAAAAAPESSTASSSRRYLESLHGYPSSNSEYGGRSDPPRQQQQPQRSVADAVVSSSSDAAAAAAAAAGREPRPRDNLSLQLALLHRQQQQQQDQQTMSALRAAAAATAPSHHHHYPSQLLGDYRVVGSAHPGLLTGGGNSHHPNPSLVAELLWLQRDLELQNPRNHHHQLSPEERKSLSPSPYPRNHRR